MSIETVTQCACVSSMITCRGAILRAWRAMRVGRLRSGLRAREAPTWTRGARPRFRQVRRPEASCRTHCSRRAIEDQLKLFRSAMQCAHNAI